MIEIVKIARTMLKVDAQNGIANIHQRRKKMDLINRQDVIKACFDTGIYDVSDVIKRLPFADGDNTEINKIKIKGTEYTIGLDQNIKEELFEEFMQSISKIPVMEHKCNNCGGIIEMDADKHIFVCPYCGTTYAIGTSMINDKGDREWM